MLGCGSSEKSYAVDVIVSGSAFALSTFQVDIGTKQLQSSGTGGQVELCTHDRELFFNAPVPLVVQQGGETVYSDTLERFGCKLSDMPGGIEINNLFLQDDGSLLHDVTAGDPRVSAWCASFGSTCSGDDL